MAYRLIALRPPLLLFPFMFWYISLLLSLNFSMNIIFLGLVQGISLFRDRGTDPFLGLQINKEGNSAKQQCLPQN